MRVATLARLLIEGPRIVVLKEDAMSTLLGTRSAENEPDHEDGSEKPWSAQRDADSQSLDQDEEPQIDKKIGVFLNRAILRIFSVPSMMQFLKDVVLFSTQENGVCKIQFVFHRLPEEAIPQLTKLLAAPRDPKYTRFVDKGQAKTGVELEVQPDDFGGEEYDYAF